jgi:hypothetical protein
MTSEDDNLLLAAAVPDATTFLNTVNTLGNPKGDPR